MGDKLLRQEIIEELDFDPSVHSAQIGVAVEDGVVTLTGHVSSYAEKVATERAVQRVKGVRAIAEEIEIRYPNDSKTADDQIAKRALDIIAWDATIPKDKINVKVQDGWVTLSSDVDWNVQKTNAERAVRRLTGVVGISNVISVKPRVKADDVKTRIERALKRSAEIDADSIKVKGGRRAGDAQGQGEGLARARSRRTHGLGCARRDGCRCSHPHRVTRADPARRRTGTAMPYASNEVLPAAVRSHSRRTRRISTATPSMPHGNVLRAGAGPNRGNRPSGRMGGGEEALPQAWR